MINIFTILWYYSSQPEYTYYFIEYINYAVIIIILNT